MDDLQILKDELQQVREENWELHVKLMDSNETAINREFEIKIELLQRDLIIKELQMELVKYKGVNNGIG